MEWWYENGPIDEKMIEEFEKKCGYKYPDSFRKIALQFDGGMPEYSTFDTPTTTERVFDSLIPFAEDEDTETVWSYIDANAQKWLIEGLDWQYVPFADDPFGDFICFDRTNDHVVFFDHETWQIEEIADSFTAFIDSLYEDPDDEDFDD